MIGIGLGLWQATLRGGEAGGTDLLTQIQAMFGGGEQGVINDLTDPANVFQERTGASATTPSGANGSIGSLKDLSPNNNWLVALSDAARPLSRQGVGAPNVYGEWDGIDDTLRVAFTIPQPFTRVASFRILNGAGVTQVFGGLTANAGVIFRALPPDVYSMFDGLIAGTVTLPVDADVCVTERHSNATSRIARDNDSYSTGVSSTDVPGGLALGSRDNGLSDFTQMRLYRLVQIGRSLTDVEIAICRTWCGAAAGLVL